ncbi:hypothetical protein ACPOL_3375 [Acidisarcina polymorpha]|uniref:Uncharacterized protein n=2 Tax=Acidisarcina polymorpha TaxID=2211140 RepID=A0A2Z5G1I5_9BACT|nr:hypothetical protein ACPOL_3375 [Acidisarcina polymorpha]
MQVIEDVILTNILPVRPRCLLHLPYTPLWGSHDHEEYSVPGPRPSLFEGVVNSENGITLVTAGESGYTAR